MSQLLCINKLKESNVETGLQTGGFAAIKVTSIQVGDCAGGDSEFNLESGDSRPLISCTQKRKELGRMTSGLGQNHLKESFPGP